MDAGEVSKHRTRASCWIVIESKVYDVTSFVDKHPGGPSLILKYAGADATKAFKEVHTMKMLDDYLNQGQCLGNLTGDLTLLKNPEQAGTWKMTSSSGVPPLITRVLLRDFQAAAKPLLSKRAYIYVNSYASLEDRVDSFYHAWPGISFRPRVMRDVKYVDTSSTILGHYSRYPFFIPPMGHVGSIHTDGEAAIARAAAEKGIHYCVSTATTQAHDAIMDAFLTQQKQAVVSDVPQSQLFLQLYVHSQHEITKEFLRRTRALGYKGLFITVDTNVIGKRIADRYVQARELLEAGIEDTKSALVITEDKSQVGGRVAPGVIDPSLNWNYLAWIRKEWDGPIVLKGIQSAEDAKIAADMGLQGIYLSNHGGRQLQDAPNCLETLLEIRSKCPEIFAKLEVYCDGSFRTGADILKALCLGVKAVAVGRPFMYATAAYGSEGVLRVVDILAEEIEMAMRLLGVTDLSQLRPDMVRIPYNMICSSRL